MVHNVQNKSSWKAPHLLRKGKVKDRGFVTVVSATMLLVTTVQGSGAVSAAEIRPGDGFTHDFLVFIATSSQDVSACVGVGDALATKRQANRDGRVDGDATLWRCCSLRHSGGLVPLLLLLLSPITPTQLGPSTSVIWLASDTILQENKELLE